MTLTPVADPGESFVGWSGTDAGDLVDIGGGSWTITMNENKDLTATFTLTLPTTMTCETFDTGWTDGAKIDNADWYSNNGPTIETGEGVAGTWGISNSGNIFIWTGESFSWADPTFESVTLQLDFETDGSAQFDDDRVGWQTVDNNVSST